MPTPTDKPIEGPGAKRRKKRKKAPPAAAAPTPPPAPHTELSRRTKVLMGGAGMALVLLLIGWQAPGAITAAGKRGFDCLNAFYRTGEGSTAACVELADGGLGWPSLVPGQTGKARDAKARVRYYAAELDLLEASARRPDAAARAAAAAKAIALRDAAPSPEELSGVPVFDIAHSGAFSEAVRFADRGRSLQDRSAALGSAAAVGDVEAVRRLAAVEPGEKSASAMDYDARRGAWLCLTGDRAAGIRALGAADAHWRATIQGAGDEGWWKFRIAILACGGKSADLDFDPAHVGAFSELRIAPVKASDPAMTAAQRDALFDDVLGKWSGGADAKDRLPFVAMQIGGVASLEQLVTKFAVDVRGANPSMIRNPFLDDRYAASFPSPWSLYASPFTDEALGLMPAEQLETAAARVAALAADAPESMPPREQAEPSVSEDEIEIRKAPGPALARYGHVLELAAGVEWVRRGDRARARAVLARASGLRGADGLLAGAHMAAGDDSAALTILGKVSPTDDDDVRALHIQKTLALAGLGRFDEAYAEIKSAGDPTDSAAVAWLLGAMALQTGDKEAIVDASGELEDAHPSQSALGSFLWWWKMIHLPEAERRVRRGRPGVTMWMLDFPPEVLPAVLRVVGEAAAGSGDVEVWLDYVFSGPHLQGPRTFPLARAEAARWRGDKAAAAVWEERAKKVFGVIRGDREAILAAAAGL